MITIGVTYYNQPDMLSRHIDAWQSFSEDVEFVLIDDFSDKRILNVPKFIKIYRILDDIKWNQTGARNLLHYVANYEWVLSMDCDHLITAEQFSKIKMLNRSNPMDVYFINREFTHNPKKNKMHSTFMCNRHTFLAVGGHDEDLAGHYGGVDQSWVAKVKHVLNYHWMDDIHVINFANDPNIKDANTTGLDRDFKRNMEIYRQKLKKGQPRGETLRFDWVREQ
jgi:hypothetical protein